MLTKIYKFNFSICKMGNTSKTLKNAENIFMGLLTLGLIGLLFLIIYGNLSGNLGFGDVTETTINETGAWINQSGYTLTKATQADFTGSATVTVAYNATDGTVIESGNYTIDSDTGIVTNTTSVNWDDVIISYTTNHKSSGKKNTEGVIGNLTGGARQFFSFSEVWFILTAITVLIGIVLGVIYMVKRVNSGENKFSS